MLSLLYNVVLMYSIDHIVIQATALTGQAGMQCFVFQGSLAGTSEGTSARKVLHTCTVNLTVNHRVSVILDP